MNSFSALELEMLVSYTFFIRGILSVMGHVIKDPPPLYNDLDIFIPTIQMVVVSMSGFHSIDFLVSNIL